MALDLMMGNYGENHQKQQHITFTTPTTASAAPIISTPTATPMESTAENLIAHETAAGLQSVENFINFLSTTTKTDHPHQQQQETAAAQSHNNNNKQDIAKPAYEFDLNCQAMADDAVTKFKRVISLLGRTRTGHARFRRGPGSTPPDHHHHPSSNYSSSTTPSPSTSPPPPTSSSFRLFPQHDDHNNNTDRKHTHNHNHVLESSAAPVLCPKPIKQVPMMMMSTAHNNSNYQFDFAGRNDTAAAALINFAANSSAGNSVMTRSTLTGEMDPAAEIAKHHQNQHLIKDGAAGSMSMSMSENGTSSFQITNYSTCSAGVVSGGRPPLSSASFKIRKCNSSLSTGSGGRCGGGGGTSSSGRCHCSRKRKLRLKRSVRVPAISSRMADIPPDEYSWRKYGQKPIKGSPHPRGYYKCSTVRGCPARKHVERALDDPAMLIVTYEGEHNHSISTMEATTANLILESS